MLAAGTNGPAWECSTRTQGHAAEAERTWETLCLLEHVSLHVSQQWCQLSNELCTHGCAGPLVDSIDNISTTDLSHDLGEQCRAITRDMEYN
jgi:hypothetical protein